MSTLDVAVALMVGMLSFTARRTAARSYLTACALCAHPTRPDELDTVDAFGGRDVPVCLDCLGELDAWACERTAADLDAAMDLPPLPWELQWEAPANDSAPHGQVA